MDDEHNTYRRQFLASTFKAGALLALGWTALPKRGLSQGREYETARDCYLQGRRYYSK